MYKRVNELLGTGFKKDSEIDWEWISIHFKLSESFIKEFKRKISWNCISSSQKLSESFIEEFWNRVSWEEISMYQKLSESFIRKFRDKVDWSNISYNQILSESFIKEFKDKVDWDGISMCQILSWNFILEFKDEVNWESVSNYQPFINPNYEKIDKDLLKENELYHLYQKTKERGWFIGYVNKSESNLIFYINYYNFAKDKVRIYWKDLSGTEIISNYEDLSLLRYLKQV